MLGLKVTINDGEPVVAGAEDLGVLTAAVTMAGELGNSTQHPRPGEAPDLFVRVGGLTSRTAGTPDEHLDWLKLWTLQVGDTITIEIVEPDQASTTISRSPAEETG